MINETLKKKIEAEAESRFAYRDFRVGDPFADALKQELIDDLAKGAALAQEWISVKDELPEVNKDGTATENVFAIVEGMQGIQVMNLSVQPGENELGEDGLFTVWSNCYGDIRGDGEWDDQYDVQFWMPLPTPPTP